MADSPTAEHRIDEHTVRALLRSVDPDLALLPLRLVAEGWDNAVWRLGESLAVRLPRRAVAAPLIAHEQRALPDLGPRLAAVGVRTPTPLISGQPGDRFPWPWSVVPWIRGATALGIPRTEAARWSGILAAALKALHHPAPADAPANPVRGVPLIARDEAMRARLAQHTRLDHHDTLRDAWTAGLAVPSSEEHVWIHGDLHPGNILVDAGELAAFIDFGDVTAGDPAYDLAASWMLFDAAGRAAFRSDTGARYDDATWIRARAWAAYLSLVLLTQSDDRPDLFSVADSTARELTSG